MNINLASLQRNSVSLYNIDPEKDIVYCQFITLILESSWGDLEYIGLAGVEILLGVCCVAANFSIVRENERIFAEPRDMASIGLFDDPRVPENLIVCSTQGNNISGKYNYNSTSDRNMWLIPFTPSVNSTNNRTSVHSITFNLGTVAGVSGIRIWNYNKAFEGITRGVKTVQIHTSIGSASGPIQQRYIGRVILRPGPGIDGVEFGQVILFRDLWNLASGYYSTHKLLTNGKTNSSTLSYMTPVIRQDYQVNYYTPETPETTAVTGVPTKGMLWKFVFLSNHGDEYYLGLDAIEMFDENGVLIDLRGVSSRGSLLNPLIYAVPESINDVLANDIEELDHSGSIHRDNRLPGSLFDYGPVQFKKPWDYYVSKHTGWLSPLSKSMTEQERLVACRRFSTSEPFSGTSDRTSNVPNARQEFQFHENNVLLILFHIPVTVSLIRYENDIHICIRVLYDGCRFYNYSKTPARGVNEFCLEVDTLLVYCGSIPRFNESTDRTDKRKPCQSVVFSNNSRLLFSEKHDVC